jgi:hypothetical protein
VRFWTLDEATAALPDVAAHVTRLRELLASARTHAGGNGGQPSGNGHGPASSGASEVQSILARLTEQGIIVRDPERGLIDFPAQAPSGRTYLLCWLEGEKAITWWHWEEDGFAGRTPLSDPPD